MPVRIVAVAPAPALQQALREQPDLRLQRFESVEQALAAVTAGGSDLLLVDTQGSAEAAREAVTLLRGEAASPAPLLLVGLPETAALAGGLDGEQIDCIASRDPAIVMRRLAPWIALVRLQHRHAQLEQRIALLQRELLAEREGRLRAEAAAAHRSAHDPLTELPNRAVFGDRLATAVERAQRSGSPLALLHVDIRNFRPVNEGYGHHVGDRLLCAVGARIRDTVRRSDTVARIGGDEFAVIAEQISDAEAARSLAEKLLEMLNLPYLIGAPDGSEPIRVEIRSCIGVALYPDHADVDALQRAAQAAVNRARGVGEGDAAVVIATADQAAGGRPSGADSR